MVCVLLALRFGLGGFAHCVCDCCWLIDFCLCVGLLGLFVLMWYAQVVTFLLG